MATTQRPGENLYLSEEFVQECFHSYLKSSLTQAKMERLVDDELLGSANADLMITGPALCLYFAALRCTTNPPSVPLPQTGSKASNIASMATELSETNCPRSFLSFLRVWVDTVPQIQGLAPEYQHDLARIICGLNPVCSPPKPVLNGIAADLRGVAIEISQRRTFQDRYAQDLQAAIDVGETPGVPRVTATFVPPPAYEAEPPTYPSPPLSPASPPYESSVPFSPPSTSRQRPIRRSNPPQLPASSVPSPQPSSGRPPPRRYSNPLPPPPVSPPNQSSIPSPPRSSDQRRRLRRPRPQNDSAVPPPVPPKDPPRPPKPTLSLPSSPRPSGRSPSPSYLSDPSTPTISIIRETLYAALADVIERSPSIQRLMKTDPPRAYFATVAFAILDVATTCITPDGEILGVMDQRLKPEKCPLELRPFLIELVGIGSAVKDCKAEDEADASEIVSSGGEPPEPRMERTKKVLERGIGYNRRQGSGEGNRLSVRGRAVTLANRINALALSTTRMSAFRDRQNDVFAVLSHLGSKP